MKIAVPSKGPGIDSEVDQRFGRGAYVLFVDSDTFEFESLDNQKNVNSRKGAGIKTGVMISGKGVAVLLTGFCGPNAFKTLKAANIKVVNEVGGNVKEAVVSFNEGKFSFADDANAEGHWI